MKTAIKRTMLAICLVLAALPAFAADDCKLRLYADIKLTMDGEGRPLIPAKFGTDDVWLVLETSLAVSLVTKSGVERLKLQPGYLNGYLETKARSKKRSQALVEEVKVAKISLGGVQLQDVVMVVLEERDQPLPVEPFEGKPIVGYLGVDMLSKVDFELNLAQRKVRLFSTEHCKSPGAYWAREWAEANFTYDELGTMLVAMQLDGKTLEATLSTMVGPTSVDPRVTRIAYGFDANSPGMEIVQPQGGEPRAVYRAMALTAPGLDIKNARIRMGDEREECGYVEKKASGSPTIGYSRCTGSAPLKLGSSVLSRLRIYVATKEKKIFFTKADATK